MYYKVREALEQESGTWVISRYGNIVRKESFHDEKIRQGILLELSMPQLIDLFSPDVFTLAAIIDEVDFRGSCSIRKYEMLLFQKFGFVMYTLPEILEKQKKGQKAQ